MIPNQLNVNNEILNAKIPKFLNLNQNCTNNSNQNSICIMNNLVFKLNCDLPLIRFKLTHDCPLEKKFKHQINYYLISYIPMRSDGVLPLQNLPVGIPSTKSSP